jgi:hypothetical protein
MPALPGVQKPDFPARLVPQPAPELKIPVLPEHQLQIDHAIANGVRYLKASVENGQQGGEHGNHATGRSALAGLTLLECGVPAADPAVVKVAATVRSATPHLRDTYSLGLAIMFLDRLGQSEDRKSIQSFALRLVAGQNAGGGWTYDCPLLSAPEEETLLTLLHQLPPLKTIVSRPLPLPNPLPREGKTPDPLTAKSNPPLSDPKAQPPALDSGLPPSVTLRNPVEPALPSAQTPVGPSMPNAQTLVGNGQSLPNLVQKQPSLGKGIDNPQDLKDPLDRKQLNLPKAIEKPSATPAEDLDPALQPDSRDRVAPKVRAPEAQPAPAPVAPAPAPVPPPQPKKVVGPIPPVVAQAPALQVIPGQGFIHPRSNHGGDHSNTQFAIMGLWAARRHDVPMERTLLLVERRFRSSQNADGSWGYHAGGHDQPDSMTCTGLLAMGLALGLEMDLHGIKIAQATADPNVRAGLMFLSTSLGRNPLAMPFPVKGKGKDHKGKGKGKGGSLVGAESRGDLYYLWSVERVAVSYRLPTITGKDWYLWGASAIVNSQQPDGSWHERYSGIPDTSFALMFLKRANLTRDLPQLAGP